MALLHEDQHVVQVRVQVIDLHPNTLDVQVPTYLPAADLTQRLARDAGLDARWPDGRRRRFFLRARGRLVREDERLADLGVVNGELVYLLPEPPPDSGVVEPPPDYPPNRGYVGQGLPALFLSLAGVVTWAVAWGFALAQARTLAVVALPGLALGLLCAGLARHAWGGRGTRLRILVTAGVLQAAIALVAFLSPKVAELVFGFPPVDVLQVYLEAVPGLILGVIGAVVGWMAWWGAAEPLPTARAVAAATGPAPVAAACAICGAPVAAAARTDCPHACGKVFHPGCHQHLVAIYRGDQTRCAVCHRSVV